jgi:transposase
MIAEEESVSKYLGLDVAKGKFDAALLREEGRVHYRTFANTPEGFASLRAWLAREQALAGHACLEATGTYGLALARFLHQAGITVSVVNPACPKAFAESALLRTKTDRVDAALLARFCQAMQPIPWSPPAPEVAELQALVRRLESVQQLHTQEQNRLEAPELDAAVKESLARVLELLEAEQARLEQQIAAHIEQHSELKAKQALLCSIPGVGTKTANVLIGEISGRDFRRARQLAAYAGLVPQEHQSGNSVRGKARLSKKGNGRLRKALYWPAVAAIRHNPTLRAFAARLREAGKPKLVIIAAVMRKLLHLAFGVLKTQHPFDPNHQPARA